MVLKIFDRVVKILDSAMDMLVKISADVVVIWWSRYQMWW